MKQKSNLLFELGVLLSKYPADEWKAVSELLENDELRHQMLAVTKALGDLAQMSSNTRIAGSRRLSTLSVADSRRGIRDLVFELNQMPTDELKRFATRNGVKIVAKDSRTRVISRTVAALSRGSGRSNRLYPVAEKRDRSRDGEYGKWVDIIMGRR